jgi:23S rRNA pseudouridine955/2504/2580 synthase
MADIRTFKVGEEDDGIRLDRWFKRNQPDVSFNLVSRWARTGQLRVDGKRVAPSERIAVGQEIRLPPPEAAPKRSAPAKPKRDPLSPEEEEFVRSLVIYEDDGAFVLNKPPGLATQGGTKTHNHLDRLLDGLADAAGNRPKLVHRLDKDTSGALLVARSARSAGFFAKVFAGRTAKKVYWALVIGVPSASEGLIDAPLSKQPGTGGEKMHVDEEHGQLARTRWRVIDRAGNRAAWVELQPLTGRTHQLRAHMASIGHPIVGDGKYGGVDSFLTGGISRKLHLHARRLKIDSPGGKIDVTAELPEHFEQSLEGLGFEAAAGDVAVVRQAKPRKPQGTKPRGQNRRGERRARSSGPRR